MRRKDREITDKNEINEILQQASVLHLGLVDGTTPYVVPMNFGFDGECIYLHSALEGRKIDILRQNPCVCFTVTSDFAVIPAEVGCKWSARYRSVMGNGRAVFVENREEKIAALDSLMRKFTTQSFPYQQAVLARTAIIKISIEQLTGKKAGW
ncbi:MAG TPA: pyridoxamine 5'-phosphate oxidase family protein [Armatimonadota bacterium]|nr:pyridoxamine 5'-phosphate oxidase family protein [Armatimonadota bacterium]